MNYKIKLNGNGGGQRNCGRITVAIKVCKIFQFIIYLFLCNCM
jgi:hypothetical protein